MAQALVNKVFEGIFKISGETAATVSAVILDKDDTQVATKTLSKREAGYLLSHTFTSTGVYTIKVTSSGGAISVDTIRVVDNISDVTTVVNSARDAVINSSL